MLFWKKSKKQNFNIGDTITVNILDPLGGLSAEELFLYGNDGSNDVRKEEWVLNQGLFDLYQRFADKKSGELYVITYYEAGERKQTCVSKEKWEYALRAAYNS